MLVFRSISTFGIAWPSPLPVIAINVSVVFDPSSPLSMIGHESARTLTLLATATAAAVGVLDVDGWK